MPLRVELMAPRDRGAGLERLPAGYFAARRRRCRTARRPYTNISTPGSPCTTHKPRVVSRAFVAKVIVRSAAAGDERSNRTTRGRSPCRTARRRRRLDRAVELADQVRRREVDLAIGGVRAGRDRRRVGGPHVRGRCMPRPATRDRPWRRSQHVCLAPAEPRCRAASPGAAARAAAAPPASRPASQQPHLLQPLQRRLLAGWRRLPCSSCEATLP